MNGAIKLHSPDGPAFNKGEVWRSSSGIIAIIESTRRYGPDKWDVEVTYSFSDGTTSSKNAWSFQTRYTHSADFVIREPKNIPKRSKNS